MSYRMFFLAAAMTMVAGCSEMLSTKNSAENTHDGKVISVSGDKVMMTNKEGKEHSHTLAAGAIVTRDGEICKAQDLVAGMRIRVTTKSGDKNVATHIEAIDKNELFANTHDGAVVSISGDKLVMTNLGSSEQHTHTLAMQAPVTCDGNACKMSDLKSGMKVRVSTKKDDMHVATAIQALDKNAEFGLRN